MTKLNKEDIIKYIVKIQLNFENAYPTSGDFERELLLESWYETLCDYPKEICDAAVNSALKKAKFAPRLGDICEEISRLMRPKEKSDEELWAALTSILGKVYEISRYLSYGQYFNWASSRLDEIYTALDEDLKLYVVNVSTLVELSEMNADSLMYERARFFKQMPILRKHSEDKTAANAFLLSLSERKALSDKKKR